MKDYMYREWASGVEGVYIKESDSSTGASEYKLINPVRMTQLMFNDVFSKVGIGNSRELSERIIVLNDNLDSTDLNKTELDAIEYFNNNSNGSGMQTLLKNFEWPGIMTLQESMGPAGPPGVDSPAENQQQHGPIRDLFNPPAPANIPPGLTENAQESYTKIVNENGTNYLKIIKPIRITKTCMSCHDKKIYYTNGNLMAITSYSASILHIEESLSNVNLRIYIVGSFIWLLGIFAMEFGYKKYRQYARNIENINQQLENSRQKLSELNDNKDKYFSILSHDLKNSFQSILSYSDYLVADFDDIDSTDLKEGIKNCNSSSKKIYKLLEDLLTWNKMQTGTLDFEPREFSASEMIKENVELLSEKAKHKEITLKNEVDDSLQIYADPDMFKAIIRNLVSNAIKFTNKDGEVKVTAESDYDKTTFSVIDTGVGISDENKEKLFKLDNSFTTMGTDKERGTGLGLIICKDMIKKHGGDIWVESTQGEGSSFRFTIPNN